jgi:hypothetical protein
MNQPKGSPVKEMSPNGIHAAGVMTHLKNGNSPPKYHKKLANDYANLEKNDFSGLGQR